MLQCIYQQPDPFEKFVYNSLVRKKSNLKAEFIVCHHTLMPKIWVVADLYSQLDPPLLSAHTLSTNCSRKEKFIVALMQQVDINVSFYNYSLFNCHIRRTSTARQRHVIEQKLQELKKWQQLDHEWNARDKEWLDNTIALDYSQAKYGKKVYLGFSTYVYSAETNCREKLGETIFSHAIHDSSEYPTVTACLCSTAGGSTHVLKMKHCLKFPPSHNDVHLLLTAEDQQSWQAEVIGALENDGIHFVAPAYTGIWNFTDGNRLINIKVLSTEESLSRSVFKFVYV